MKLFQKQYKQLRGGDDVEPKNRQWIGIVYLVAFVIITACIEIGYCTGCIHYGIEDFDVSGETVFVGKNHKIDVYENSALSYSIPIPFRAAYSLKVMPGNIIELENSRITVCLNLSGEKLSQTNNSERSYKHYEIEPCTDEQGNLFEYRKSFFRRGKILKNGREIVLTETRLNCIATIIKHGQFLEALLAFALIDGKGHPILWVKIIAKRWSERKSFRFNRFYRYFNQYYGTKASCKGNFDNDADDVDMPSWSDFWNSVKR